MSLKRAFSFIGQRFIHLLLMLIIYAYFFGPEIPEERSALIIKKVRIFNNISGFVFVFMMMKLLKDFYTLHLACIAREARQQEDGDQEWEIVEQPEDIN